MLASMFFSYIDKILKEERNYNQIKDLIKKEMSHIKTFEVEPCGIILLKNKWFLVFLKNQTKQCLLCGQSYLFILNFF